MENRQNILLAEIREAIANLSNKVDELERLMQEGAPEVDGKPVSALSEPVPPMIPVDEGFDLGIELVDFASDVAPVPAEVPEEAPEVAEETAPEEALEEAPEVVAEAAPEEDIPLVEDLAPEESVFAEEPVFAEEADLPAEPALAEEPVLEAPADEPVVADEPAVEEPVEAPVVETPVDEAPVVEAPAEDSALEEPQSNVSEEDKQKYQVISEFDLDTMPEPLPEEKPAAYPFQEPAPAPEAPPEPISINDLEMRRLRPAVNDVMTGTYAWMTDKPAKKVNNVLCAVSLNDRKQITDELFGGNSILYMNTMTMMNKMTSLDEVVSYVSENFVAWDLNSKPVYIFMMAVRRRLG